MHARIRPVFRPAHKSVLDRIDPAIAQVRVEILFSSDVVVPEPALPEAAFVAGDVTGPQGSCGQSVREPGFDQAPAGREIPVVWWQSPDAMQVIGQNDPRLYVEGAFELGETHGVPQPGDLADQQVALVIGEGHGEKDRGSGEFGAQVSGHDAGLRGVG